MKPVARSIHPDGVMTGVSGHHLTNVMAPSQELHRLVGINPKRFVLVRIGHDGSHRSGRNKLVSCLDALLDRTLHSNVTSTAKQESVPFRASNTDVLAKTKGSKSLANVPCLVRQVRCLRIDAPAEIHAHRQKEVCIRKSFSQRQRLRHVDPLPCVGSVCLVDLVDVAPPNLDCRVRRRDVRSGRCLDVLDWRKVAEHDAVAVQGVNNAQDRNIDTQWDSLHRVDDAIHGGHLLLRRALHLNPRVRPDQVFSKIVGIATDGRACPVVRRNNHRKLDRTKKLRLRAVVPNPVNRFLGRNNPGVGSLCRGCHGLDVNQAGVSPDQLDEDKAHAKKQAVVNGDILDELLALVAHVRHNLLDRGPAPKVRLGVRSPPFDGLQKKRLISRKTLKKNLGLDTASDD